MFLCHLSHVYPNAKDKIDQLRALRREVTTGQTAASKAVAVVDGTPFVPRRGKTPHPSGEL